MDLMSAVVRLCPSVCESGHLAVLLGAYGASLSILGEDVTGSVWGLGGGVTKEWGQAGSVTRECVGTGGWCD